MAEALKVVSAFICEICGRGIFLKAQPTDNKNITLAVRLMNVEHSAGIVKVIPGAWRYKPPRLFE